MDFAATAEAHADDNNSINENVFNATRDHKKHLQLYQLKKMLRPLLSALKRKVFRTNRKSYYKKSPEPSYFAEASDSKVYFEDESQSSESDDNIANELLEAQLFEEIDCCERNAGISVYTSSDHLDIVPVFRGQRYIPVHFAKTEAGTFFWTSMVGPDCDVSDQGDRHPICNYQKPELQVPYSNSCRWAQA